VTIARKNSYFPEQSQTLWTRKSKRMVFNLSTKKSPEVHQKDRKKRIAGDIHGSATLGNDSISKTLPFRRAIYSDV